MRVVNLLFLIISCSHGIFALEKLSPEIKKCYQKYSIFKQALDNFFKDNRYFGQVLNWTVQHNRQEFITELIEKDMIASPVYRDYLFSIVNYNCYPDIIELFIKKRPAHTEIHTLLTKTTDETILELLLSYGANINELMPNFNNSTILFRAVLTNQKNLIKLFLEHGAQVNFRSSYLYLFQASPICSIIENTFDYDLTPYKENLENLNLLIKAGAQVRKYHIEHIKKNIDKWNNWINQNSKKVPIPFNFFTYLNGLNNIKGLQPILEKIRKEQHTTRRLTKNVLRNVNRIIKPFKIAYQIHKSSSLKPADMIQWPEFQDVLPIATARAPQLIKLITT